MGRFLHYTIAIFFTVRIADCRGLKDEHGFKNPRNLCNLFNP